MPDEDRIYQIAINVAAMRATVEAIDEKLDTHIAEGAKASSQHDKRIVSLEKKVAVHVAMWALLGTGTAGIASFFGFK